MTELWLPGWDRIEGETSGTWAPDDEIAAKFVVHSTEGHDIAGAVASFRANRSWPHATADPWRMAKVQHNPLNRPARALKNTTVPGETNREPYTVQLEIVGTAHDPDRAGGLRSLATLTDEQLDWLALDVIGPMCAAMGVPVVRNGPARFYSERCGWTLASSSARQRLTAAEWDKAAGIFGHVEVPENDHWDPGPLNIGHIIDTINNGSTDDMNDDDRARARRIEQKLDRLIISDRTNTARVLEVVRAVRKLLKHFGL